MATRPARLPEALRRAVLKIDAHAAEQRRQRKLAQRTVREYPTGAGALEIHGDTIRTQTAAQRTRAIAKQRQTDDAAEGHTLH